MRVPFQSGVRVVVRLVRIRAVRVQVACGRAYARACARLRRAYAHAYARARARACAACGSRPWRKGTSPASISASAGKKPASRGQLAKKQQREQNADERRRSVVDARSWPRQVPFARGCRRKCSARTLQTPARARRARASAAETILLGEAATTSDPAPENSPLTVTICAALFWESIRVQVVLNAPADAGTQHQQRTRRKRQIARAVQREQEARQRDKRNGRPKAARDRLRKERQRHRPPSRQFRNCQAGTPFPPPSCEGRT